jgi:phage terminase small subunit
MAAENERQLTPKQRRWANAYLGEARGNATEAARIAGYSDPEVSGFDCKRNQAIRAYVDERLDAETLSSKEVLAELTDVARAEWRDFLLIRRDKDGEILDVRMDLGSKIKSLELLGKHHQLFTDKIDISGKMTFADLFAIAQSEAGASDPAEGG